VDAGDDVFSFFSPGNQGDHLRLGKDRTEVADPGRIIRFERQVAEAVQIHLEGPGHDLQEASRPGGTFVVHDKIRYLSLGIHDDGLAVLAPDVDDGNGSAVRGSAPRRRGT
jgi:hypothetical protein